MYHIHVYLLKTKCMIMIREALYLNCEIYDPLVRGSDSRMEPIWPYSKNVLNPRKSSSLLRYLFVKTN